MREFIAQLARLLSGFDRLVAHQYEAPWRA
jgi:hypothetical protein